MNTTLFSHPKLTVRMRTGSEGPRHDPYSFMDLVIETPERTVVVHEGFVCSIKCDGSEIEPPRYLLRLKYTGKIKLDVIEKVEQAWRDETVEQLTGWTLAQIGRINSKLRSRCRCGSRTFSSTPGYPGETFVVCDSCGRIHDSIFCESEII